MSFETYFQNYFNPEQPVCREERQYALFLCEKIEALIPGPNSGDSYITAEEDPYLNACGICGRVRVQSALYEVTFMRDIFWRQRSYWEEKNGRHRDWTLRDFNCSEQKDAVCFNKELLQYACGHPEEDLKMKEITPYVPAFLNLGGSYTLEKSKKGGHSLDEKYEVQKKRLRELMNAKPDLAVIYSAEGDDEKLRHLKFIECKYLSKEDSYKATDDRQTDVQNHIGSFLESQSGKRLKFEETQLLYFKSDANKDNLNDACHAIELKTLIPDRWKGGIL